MIKRILLLFICCLLISSVFVIYGENNIKESDLQPASSTEPTNTAKPTPRIEPKREDYVKKFNQVYKYDNIPTLKIEAYFDDLTELSELLKKSYEDQMNKLPVELTLKLKNRGVVVHYVQDIHEYYSKMYVNGFFNPNNNQIYISCWYDEKYDIYVYIITKVEGTLYHEIGHAVDWAYGHLSDSKEFKDIFKEEKKYTSTINEQSSSEYFADSFALFALTIDDYSTINSARHTFKKCPKTKEFLQNKLNLEDSVTLYILHFYKPYFRKHRFIYKDCKVACQYKQLEYKVRNGVIVND